MQCREDSRELQFVSGLTTQDTGHLSYAETGGLILMQETIGKDINSRKWISLPILADFNNYHRNIKVRGYKYFSNFWLILIIGVFIALTSRVLFLNPDPWWDAAVYGGMGMFMFSGGDVGLWEPARPPVLPILLGALWWVGLDAQWWGMLIGILAGAGCIAISFGLGNLIGKKGTGTLAALFLAFSPTFFLFSQVNQTEIISLFMTTPRCLLSTVRA